MSVEERLDLIGKIFDEIELDPALKSDATLTLTTEINDSNYELRLRMESSVSAKLSDNDANSSDYHWYSESVWRVLDSEGAEVSKGSTILGYGGSNNNQYDHWTWDTVFGSEYINLLPGHKIEYIVNLKMTNSEVTNPEAKGSYTIYQKGIGVKAVVVGALEII